MNDLETIRNLVRQGMPISISDSMTLDLALADAIRKGKELCEQNGELLMKKHEKPDPVLSEILIEAWISEDDLKNLLIAHLIQKGLKAKRDLIASEWAELMERRMSVHETQPQHQPKREYRFVFEPV